MDNGQGEILSFQIQRNISALCKNFLNILEDLQQQHISQFNKLEESLPPEYESIVLHADYFDDDKFNHLRKRVLDKGGEISRDLQEELRKYQIKVLPYEEVQYTERGKT